MISELTLLEMKFKGLSPDSMNIREALVLAPHEFSAANK
jgi:hypothetical protein